LACAQPVPDRVGTDRQLTDEAGEILRAHLEASGQWTRQVTDTRRSIWRNRDGVGVFIPKRSGPDRAALLARLIRDLASVEGRSEEDVVIDLAWPSYDRLRLTRKTQEMMVPIDEAIALHEALNDLIVAGARAAEEPRAAFSGRRPHTVEDYLQGVRVLPSAPGSFVVRALLPLKVAPTDQMSLPLFGPTAAQIHQVSSTIMKASHTALETAKEVTQGANLQVWEDVIPEGVSANLCDALARLPGEDEALARNVEVSIGWTWSAEPDVPRGPLDVPAGLAPVLSAASTYLRGEPEEHTIRLTGLVTKLHRDRAAGPGEVTVRGLIEDYDSGPRSLRSELDERTYREAIQAHDAGATVQVSANVRRGARGFEVLRVSDFRRVPKESTE
jgi:hypothetical protein